MADGPRRVTAGAGWPLFDIAATRLLERTAQQGLPDHALMRRAGLATARLAMGLAPHAQSVWVAAGPGNNGGDGMEAALHLRSWGKSVVVTLHGAPASLPVDARAAWQRAVDAGVVFANEPPDDFELCLDGLLGIGATRPATGRMAQAIECLNGAGRPVLAIDVPSGLQADTGATAGPTVRASATLALLTLKPGLFTAQGRDTAGQVWFDDLGAVSPAGSTGATPCAMLGAAPPSRPRAHATHKGSYGDVAVVGGATGMAGAALLAGSAALHAGVGRVYVALLDRGAAAVDNCQPELMLRSAEELDIGAMTVVCGCGGGDAVRAQLPRILSACPAVVLDADALNALASDPQLQSQLRRRADRGWRTVLTPHPLEAARLLGCSSGEVQQDRLAAAARLVQAFACTVVLKGSGTVVAAPATVPVINPTGNARLATAGTGDVLAGLTGAALAAGLREFQAACEAVYRHGSIADGWPAAMALTASSLARALQGP